MSSNHLPPAAAAAAPPPPPAQQQQQQRASAACSARIRPFSFSSFPLSRAMARSCFAEPATCHHACARPSRVVVRSISRDLARSHAISRDLARSCALVPVLGGAARAYSISFWRFNLARSEITSSALSFATATATTRCCYEGCCCSDFTPTWTYSDLLGLTHLAPRREEVSER